MSEAGGVDPDFYSLSKSPHCNNIFDFWLKFFNLAHQSFWRSSMRKSITLLLLLLTMITLPLFARDPMIYFSIVFRKQITVVGQDVQVFGLY